MLSTEVRHTPISATPRATAMVRRLVREHGPLAIYQSGGCCDGSLPLCLLADELGQGPNDVLLGHVARIPFYIDAEQYERWGEPEFLLDVVSGAPEGFSLGLPDAHFVTLSLSGKACTLRAAWANHAQEDLTAQERKTRAIRPSFQAASFLSTGRPGTGLSPRPLRSL